MRRKKWYSAGLCGMLAFSLCFAGGQTASLATVGYAQEEVHKSEESAKEPKAAAKTTERSTEKSAEKSTEKAAEKPT